MFCYVKSEQGGMVSDGSLGLLPFPKPRKLSHPLVKGMLFSRAFLDSAAVVEVADNWPFGLVLSTSPHP